MSSGQERGSASVELAFSLPVLVFVFLLFAQTASVMVNQLAVMQAAREGARAIAVGESSARATAAARQATGLDPRRLDVRVGSRHGADGLVRVDVAYKSAITVPFTSRVLLSPTVRAHAAMATESTSR